MHDGRIDAKLFGNFVELLDDVVPSMWAEMINDRDFDGVFPSRFYYRGEPNPYLDQEWEVNNTWSRVQDNVFCGTSAAKLMPVNGQAMLSQPGMFVAKGQSYNFSGWFRVTTEVKITVSMKTLLPNGSWLVLATTSETIKPDKSKEWQKVMTRMTSSGTSEHTVFELTAKAKDALWVDKFSLMPSDNMDGWRKDVIDVIRPLKLAIIRWGGSVVDPGDYRWKDGIGPRDKRVSFANKVWGRMDSNDVGLDEFIQFCRLVDSEPLICISFSDGPQSAADIVHYCNDAPSTEWGKRRAENGYPEPYHVKYFQLGNELGGEDYAEKCAPFCKAMKEAGPDILLAASYATQKLFDLVGKDIAFVCPHHYTRSLTEHEQDIENHVNMIRSTPGCGHIRLGITEWNFTAGDWGNGRALIQSLYSGLYSAQYFNLMMRRSDYVALACRSNISNSFEGGTIMTKPGAVMKTPFYHTTKLYADYFQPIPWKVETAPTGVNTVACVSEDGKTMSLFLVNTNRQPVDIRFDLSEWNKTPVYQTGASVVDVKNRGQLDIINHWTDPDRITTVNLDTVPATLPRYSTTVVVFKKP
jgi:alpha-N-arabinofuranosidase